MINQIIVYAKLHEKRQYEYLLISGLHKFKYFNGLLQYISLESVYTSLSFALTFMIYNVCNSTVVVNFLCALCTIPAAISYCFSFCIFSYGLFDNSAAILVFATLFGFLPGNIITLLGSILHLTGFWFKIIVGIVQLLLPGSGMMVILIQITQISVKVQNGEVNGDFGKYLTQDSENCYSIIVSMIMSVVSFIVYYAIGFYIDSTRKDAKHPTQDEVFPKGNIYMDDNKLLVKNLCVTFQKTVGKEI